MDKKNTVIDKEYGKKKEDNIHVPTDSEKGFPLAHINEEYFNMSDLILNDNTKKRLEYFIAENQSCKKLLSYGLKPKQKILFCGPPGTGKTLSAKVMSSIIGYPLVYVQFDVIVSHFLGQTANNIHKIFDFIEGGKYVVLFDEFDVVAKKRDDEQEHGEIKRVVNNFMQLLDTYRGESILVAATNHQHLLDFAIWRRFDEILLFELPSDTQRYSLFKKYLKVLKHEPNLALEEFVKHTAKFSAADIAAVCENGLRRAILSGRTEVRKLDLNWALDEQNRKKQVMNG